MIFQISINLRLPEGRHKVENATLRNGEYSMILNFLSLKLASIILEVFKNPEEFTFLSLERILRREAAKKAKWEAEELAKNPVVRP